MFFSRCIVIFFDFINYLFIDDGINKIEIPLY